MKRMHGFIAMVLAVLMLLSVTVYGKKEIKPDTLKVLIITSWEKDGLDAVLKNLTKETGISLEVEKVPEGEQGNTVIRTRFATNEKPDLLFYYTNVGEIRKLGNIDELFLKQDGQAWIKNFDKQAWLESMSADGKYYAAPYWGANAGGILYNKKVFKAAGVTVPKNWAELLQVCATLKAKGKIPYYISGKDGWTVMLTPWFAASKDLSVFKPKLESNQMKFSGYASFKDGLSKLIELKNKGFINSDYLSATYDNAQKALASGDTGMYPMVTFVIAAIAQKFPDKVNDIGFFPLPILGNGKDKVATWSPWGLYAVKGPKQDAAQRFVNYFESIPVQNKYFAVEGGIPAIKGVTKTKLSPAELEAKSFVDKGLGVDNFGTNWRYEFGDSGAQCQDALIGTATVDQTTESMQKELEKAAKAANDPHFQ
jgi:raffinose/stachyose/melibiose transport system substrate-binding protein